MGQLCSASATVRDERTLLANVAQVNSKSQTFPGTQASIVRGLCVSGGGSRALSNAFGFFRALHDLGLLPRFDAISSVSGGSWASSILMFATTYKKAKVDTSEVLGNATSPGKLTMQELSKPPAPMGAVITAPSLPIAEELVKELVESDRLWTTFIGRWILGDFGLDSMDAFMAASSATRDRIIEDNPALADKTFYIPRTDMPKNFIINGTLLAPVGYFAGPQAGVSFQMSPDYVGSPFYPNNEKVTYTRAPHLCRDCVFALGCPTDAFALADCCTTCCGCCGLTLIVGGGMVETFAFGGKQPAPPGQSGGKVEVGYPAPSPLSLAQAAGISSLSPGVFDEHFADIGRLANPRMTAWPVTSNILPGPQRARSYEFADGGNLENAGPLALMQRKATQVVWICSSFRAFNTTYDFAKATAETFNPDEAGVVDQLYDKFGYGTNDISEFLGNNQVFEQALLLDLVRELVGLKDAGKPAVAQRKYTVQPNTYWGIEGGYAVDVLIYYLETVGDFEAQLPPDTQRELAKKGEGPFANFPIFKTTDNNPGEPFGLTACQVNLLAAQAEFCVAQNKELFQKCLA